MKLMKQLRILLSAVLCITAMPSVSARSADALVDSRLDYTESTETIDNPGAGYTSTLWMSCAPNDTPIFNPTGNLMLILVDLGGFSSGSNGITNEDGSYTAGTDYDLDETFFTNLRQTLDNCRRNGCTIALRFRYDDVGKLDPEPATYDKMVDHINQICDNGLLEDYKDIIAFVESGFVGSWGEHWGGKFCSFEDKARLLDILLDVVPKEIPVTVRTPMTFVTWAGIAEEDLGEYIAEPGSDAARVCLYNDGYMGSDIDLGTYHDRERDTTWVGRQAVTSYFGGEFSGNLEFTMQYDTYLPENSIPEMYKTHLSYINSNIYQLYKDYTFGAQYDVENVDNSAYYGETVYKFMRDHLGYRFVVRDCDLSAQVEQGGILTLRADIENTGFANPLMEQKPEIILEKDGNYIRTQVDVNTREWYSRTTVSPEFELKLPSALDSGEWNVYFKLSTGNNTLEEMHMRSVKFANNGTWNSALGANYLGSFTVTASDGTTNPDHTFYQVNAENEVSVSNGEMFTINNIAAADGFTTVPSERAEEIKYDESDGNSLYITNDDKYLYVMAELRHNAGAPVYNLSFDNKTNGEQYWLYYQGNGFIYFNHGKPFGVVQKHNGATIEFRIPFGEVMGIENGAELANVRVNIQDEADSWKSVASVTAKEYKVSDNFNVYSAMQTVHLTENEAYTMRARTSAEGLQYQWLFNGTPIKGATEAEYTLTAASADSEGVYSVIITSQNETEKTVDICKVAQVQTSALKGDVNLDGTVSTADVILLQKYLHALAPFNQRQADAADMDENGYVSAFDLAFLKRALLS